MRVLRVSLVMTCLFLAPAAGAQHPELHLDLEAGTDLPISVGAILALQAPYGVRVSTGLGVLPRAYVSLINEVVVALDGYDERTAALVDETLQNSLVWRTHIGWIADFGLYVDVGYSMAALGGGTSTEAIISAVTGRSAPMAGPTREYEVASVLHMLDAEIGWKGVFWGTFIVRAALGFSGTLASSTTVEQRFNVNSPAVQRGVDELERFTEGYLNDTYQSYVFTPVVTVSLGYRIF